MGINIKLNREGFQKHKPEGPKPESLPSIFRESAVRGFRVRAALLSCAGLWQRRQPVTAEVWGEERGRTEWIMWVEAGLSLPPCCGLLLLFWWKRLLRLFQRKVLL